jgi:hypothetical protein
LGELLNLLPLTPPVLVLLAASPTVKGSFVVLMVLGTQFLNEALHLLLDLSAQVGHGLILAGRRADQPSGGRKVALRPQRSDVREIEVPLLVVQQPFVI